MGNQLPEDLSMQEGLLSTNDLNTGSISQKAFPFKAGTGLCPLPAPQSMFGNGTHWTQKPRFSSG